MKNDTHILHFFTHIYKIKDKIYLRMIITNDKSTQDINIHFIFFIFDTIKKYHKTYTIQ